MIKCEVCCNRNFRREEVEEIFHVDRRYVLVEHIPATVCVQCGEKTFDAATAEGIRQTLHGQRQPTRSVAMEVFAF
jgi:YgiT-type zinc finger domain-containing protein